MTPELSIWVIIGMLWALVLIVELAVVLIWIRGAARWWAAGGVAGLLVVQVFLPGLLTGPVGAVVHQLLNLGALTLLAFAVIASRPAHGERSD